MFDNKEDLVARQQSAGQLIPFILKNIPYMFAGGALLGLFKGFTSGLPFWGLALICALVGLAGIIICTPVIVLKWYLMRSDSTLTPQQQIVVGLGSWKVRAAISALFTGISIVGIVFSGDIRNGDWSIFFVLPVIIFFTTWAMHFVLKASIPIPMQNERQDHDEEG